MISKCQSPFLSRFFCLQNVSNLWLENQTLLELDQSDGINPVLALSADVLTENIFIITENHQDVDDNFPKEKLEKLIGKLKKLLVKCPQLALVKDLKPYLIKTESDDQLLLMNPLVMKKRKLCQNADEKMAALNKLLEK